VTDYAWIPARLSPYVGGGVGYTWYRLEQDGEFLNVGECERNPETGCGIFVQTYVSRAGGLTAHGLAGVEFWVLPRVALSLEGRYTHGSAGLSQHFRNWESIDLTHFEAGLGLSVRW
jgi:opacity protein-like surface antigen